jgi:hypothetical protein
MERERKGAACRSRQPVTASMRSKSGREKVTVHRLRGRDRLSLEEVQHK